MRRRINISVDEELYLKLNNIKDRYGFRSVCEFDTALLRLLCQYVDAAEDREHEDDTITDMFNAFGDWENTPYGIVPVRHNNKKLE